MPSSGLQKSILYCANLHWSLELLNCKRAELKGCRLAFCIGLILQWSLGHTQLQACRAQSCRMAYCIVLILHWSLGHIPLQACRAQSCRMAYCIVLNLHWSLGHTQLQACRALSCRMASCIVLILQLRLIRWELTCGQTYQLRQMDPHGGPRGAKVERLVVYHLHVDHLRRETRRSASNWT